VVVELQQQFSPRSRSWAERHRRSAKSEWPARSMRRPRTLCPCQTPLWSTASRLRSSRQMESTASTSRPMHHVWSKPMRSPRHYLQPTLCWRRLCQRSPARSLGIGRLVPDGGRCEFPRTRHYTFIRLDFIVIGTRHIQLRSSPLGVSRPEGLAAPLARN
jgi:hypothetical protein